MNYWIALEYNKYHISLYFENQCKLLLSSSPEDGLE